MIAIFYLIAHIGLILLKNQNSMAKKEDLDNKRELARIYFMSGEPQNKIAKRVGVSAATVSSWVEKGGWKELRAVKNITRQELIAKMLFNANEKLEQGIMSADEMVNIAAAIEKIDKKTNIITIIEVFSVFDRWLITRLELEAKITAKENRKPELIPELLKLMNKYHNMFISESISKTDVKI